MSVTMEDVNRLITQVEAVIRYELKDHPCEGTMVFDCEGETHCLDWTDRGGQEWGLWVSGESRHQGSEFPLVSCSYAVKRDALDALALLARRLLDQHRQTAQELQSLHDMYATLLHTMRPPAAPNAAPWPSAPVPTVRRVHCKDGSGAEVRSEGGDSDKWAERVTSRPSPAATFSYLECCDRLGELTLTLYQ